MEVNVVSRVRRDDNIDCGYDCEVRLEFCRTYQIHEHTSYHARDIHVFRKSPFRHHQDHTRISLYPTQKITLHPRSSPSRSRGRTVFADCGNFFFSANRGAKYSFYHDGFCNSFSAIATRITDSQDLSRLYLKILLDTMLLDTMISASISHYTVSAIQETSFVLCFFWVQSFKLSFLHEI